MSSIEDVSLESDGLHCGAVGIEPEENTASVIYRLVHAARVEVIRNDRTTRAHCDLCCPSVSAMCIVVQFDL